LHNFIPKRLEAHLVWQKKIKNGSLISAQLMEERRIETNKAMAFALLEGLRATDEDNELWQLVEEMMNQDAGLVSKLEFTIASIFIEKGLAPRQGEDYAH
jgi:hypothetical protein